MLRILKEAQNRIVSEFLFVYASIEIAAKIQSLFFKQILTFLFLFTVKDISLDKFLCFDLIKKVK